MLIETKILNRRGIGFDISPDSVELTKRNLDFNGDYKYEQIVMVVDVRNLKEISYSSIDLIIMRTSYLNIINYSNFQLHQVH